MGMAAGQARLLSITSRMSDNELRAQIINNQKMRLATESSQVSEAYINALNQAQMMFTNYDADNNASYQQLTFNSLTSYNPYNNQYGLVNASGQILVSERDATNFINADGDMDKFLKAYGLEQTTTYFDQLEKYLNTTYTDEDGNDIWPNDKTKRDNDGNVIEVPILGTDENGNTTYVGSGYTIDELKDMFFGGNGHSGYEAALSSSVYNDYVGYAEKFDAAYTAYASTIADKMTEKLNSLVYNEKNLGDISEYFNNTFSDTASNSDYTSYLEALREILTTAKKYCPGTEENSQERAYLQTYIDEVKGMEEGTSTENIGGTVVYSDDPDAGDIVFTESGGKQTLTINDTLRIVKDENGYSIEAMNEAENSSWSNIGSNLSGSITKISYKVNEDGTLAQDADGNNTFSFGDGGLDALFREAAKSKNDEDTKIEITETNPIDSDSIKATVTSIINSLATSIYNLWDVNNTEFINEEIKKDDGTTEKIQETDAHLAYRNAAAAFIAHLLGGTPVTATNADPTKPNEYQIVQITGKDGNTYTIELSEINKIATDPTYLDKVLNDGVKLADGNNLSVDKDALQDLLDVIALNNIMNTYGEPNVTWIDTSSPTDSYNENGEAKYNWYANLFARMQNGFKVLQDGLASSNEWIQFALENGLVTMEQVDKDGNWNGLNYSNCSDITEQTNDQAVAIAEAEYNAAMNKIENKDKKFDLELKNIDTEHNSLQTEYDSIKTAIDKNIERTFKIYS